MMISHKQLAEMGRHWTPPDSLDQSRPRLVCLTAGGKGALLLALILFLGSPTVGTLLGLKAVREAEEAHLLQAEGVVTEGVIVRLWRSGDKSKQTWAAYRFGNSNFSREKNVRLPLSLWRELGVGASLPICYVPSHPEINYPLRLPMGVLPFWVPFLVSGILVAGGLLPLYLIHREKKLLEQGRVAPALVTGHDKAKHGSSYGKEQVRKYHYEFPLLSGAMAHGSAGPVKKPPGIGSVIPVLYYPENPHRNEPYPLLLVKLLDRGWYRQF